MKELVMARLQQVDAELEKITNDYKIYSAHVKDLETKIIFIKGQKEELTLLANELNKERDE